MITFKTYPRSLVGVIAFMLLMLTYAPLSAVSFYQPKDGLTYVDVLDFEYEKMTHHVELALLDDAPLHYYAELLTPVCEDSICELLRLEVYWDLLGNYLGFDTIATYPLTKYDHSPFSAADYQKLDVLLKTPLPALESMKLSELVSKEDSANVDAHSGATALEVKNEVVEGAAYSCHVMWHIMNRVGRLEVFKYTKNQLNANWILVMLQSSSENYASYLFSIFQEEDFKTYQGHIKKLFAENDWAVKSLIENMADEYQLPASMQMAMLEQFEQLHAMTRYQLIILLKAQQKVSPDCLVLLSQHLYTMSYMQVQEMSELYQKNKANFSPEVAKAIKAYTSDENAKYAFLLEGL